MIDFPHFFRALTLACMVSIVCSPPVHAEQDLLPFFDDVVFAGKQNGKVYKWSRGPSVRMETVSADENHQPVTVDNDPRLYKALSERISVIAEASGLNIRLLPDGMDEGGDLVVQLMPVTLFSTLAFPGVSARYLRQLTGPGRCFFLAWPRQDGTISKAHVVINSILAEDHIKHCFYEEVVQSLGVPNDSDRLQPSIFNEVLMVSELSDTDRTILRIFYDPLIKPGADRLTVLDLVRTILRRDADR